MRSGTGTLADLQFTDLVETGINKLPTNTREIWRASTQRPSEVAELWERAIPGSEFDLGNQLQSFSTDKDFAVCWSREARTVINIKKPTSGAFVEDISQHLGENEVLVSSKVRYRVVGRHIEQHNGEELRIIELEMINDD